MTFIPLQDYHWSTDYFHPDNTFTMQDFLDNHLPDKFIVVERDESYAEIENVVNGLIYAVDAKGNGDSYNHIVTSGLIS